MKKAILLFASISSAIFLNAQNFNWGVRAGLNVSSLGDYELSMTQNQDSELGSKVGPYAGIFGQFKLYKNLGLETGLFYSQLGGKDKENDYDNGYLEQYKIEGNSSYLQLPVTLHYKFNIIKSLSIYPSLGVYAGYGLAGKIKTLENIGGVNVDSSEDYFKDFNRFDFGAAMGLNVEYRKFILGFHYDRGFTRVNEEEVIFGDNAYNSNFRVALSYMFR